MASFLDKVKVKEAVDTMSKFDLGCDHISTANWMQYNVAYSKELVPKEKIDVKMATFTRMLPLERPTFGRANINNRAFFVPYRTIFPAWNEFITDSVHVPFTSGVSPSIGSGNIYTSVPVISNAELIKLFVMSDFSSTVGSGVADFTAAVSDANNNIAGITGGQVGPRVFTSLGRQAMKILQSLGYEISFDGSFDDTYSALPLFAVAKVYTDWYFPSAYLDSVQYNYLVGLFKVDNSGYSVTANDLSVLFKLIVYVNYDSDYFNSAWDSPVGPNNGNYSTVNIVDVSSAGVYTNATSPNLVSGIKGSVGNGQANLSDGERQGSLDGTPIIKQQKGSSGAYTTAPITQYLVTALKKLTDYMKRHQIVGARAIDRYLARFGINLDSAKTDRSLYLGVNKVPLQIGDVMSTANTAYDQSTGTGLGDYAGRGLGYGEGHWNFDTDEFGQFIIISTIIPAIGYYQGIDRNVKHVSKLDFFTPEFDSLGTQAIQKSEVIMSSNGGQALGQQGMQNGIFGYVPRYAEYKISRDRLTGDYRYASRAQGEDSWYLFRDMTKLYPASTGQSAVVHSLDFGRGTDWDQYNRIFQSGSSVTDLFRMIYHYEIASWSPMKGLYENYEFDSDGNSVTEDVNGVKVN